jgi:hypothetical protein
VSRKLFHKYSSKTCKYFRNILKCFYIELHSVVRRSHSKHTNISSFFVFFVFFRFFRCKSLNGIWGADFLFFFLSCFTIIYLFILNILWFLFLMSYLNFTHFINSHFINIRELTKRDISFHYTSFLFFILVPFPFLSSFIFIFLPKKGGQKIIIFIFGFCYLILFDLFVTTTIQNYEKSYYKNPGNKFPPSFL